jgi:TatD-related deoxyribonuclease
LLSEGWGVDEVEEFMRRSVDLAVDYVRRGEAVGIGEIGRPHWEIQGETMGLFNRVIDYAMGRAKDFGAVIQLHLERGGRATAESILSLAKANGLRDYQVVMHHSQPINVGFDYDNGLMPSVPVGRKGEFEEAVKYGPRFLVESDYIDDPRYRHGRLLGR